MGHRGDLPACGKGCVGIPLSSSRYFFISEDVLHSKDGWCEACGNPCIVLFHSFSFPFLPLCNCH